MSLIQVNDPQSGVNDLEESCFHELDSGERSTVWRE